MSGGVLLWCRYTKRIRKRDNFQSVKLCKVFFFCLFVLWCAPHLLACYECEKNTIRNVEWPSKTQREKTEWHKTLNTRVEPWGDYTLCAGNLINNDTITSFWKSPFPSYVIHTKAARIQCSLKTMPFALPLIVRVNSWCPPPPLPLPQGEPPTSAS